VAGLGDELRAVVGSTAAKLRAELGLVTVGDLLRHYPRRYVERGQLSDLGSLQLDEHVSVVAQVAKAQRRPMRSRKGWLTEVVITDGRGTLSLTFFARARGWDLTEGTRAVFSGKVSRYGRTLQLKNPDYLLLPAGIGADSLDLAPGLVALYPATANVRTWTIAKSVQVALDTLDTPPDPLPARLRASYRLVDLATALHGIHLPASREELDAARARLTWDEAMTVQVTLAQRRRAASTRPALPRPARDGGLLAAFDAALPFALTAGQREVGERLAGDLAQAHPMHRLLQGEVGSGKTVVALRAMLQVVDAGGQAALLAPTEVLASQHLATLRTLLGPLGTGGELGSDPRATSVALLHGSAGAHARRRALAQAADGSAGIVVGTHALLSEGVRFSDLGLVVVDEQHRFGVEQRDALRAKGEQPPHLLVMTATPIPRTVAMTVYGDLEVSTLRELPAGRAPITTSVIPVPERPAWLGRAWQRVREEVAAGHQAYVVAARIGEAADREPGSTAQAEDLEWDQDWDRHAGDSPVAGDGGGNGGGGSGSGSGSGSGNGNGSGSGGDSRRPAAAVLDVLPLLGEGPLAGLRLGLLHGRLPGEEKDAVMRAFAAGSLDVLVATTVVEVGVDVPNATAMVVLDADRFGVSQLHQLRGRVGRGSAAGVCLLVTDAPAGTPARQRLDAVAATLDGFVLARHDLEQRREGDVLGVAQSGTRSQLRLLSLLHHEALLEQARAEATALVEADPELVSVPALADAVAALVVDERADYLEKA